MVRQSWSKKNKPIRKFCLFDYEFYTLRIQDSLFKLQKLLYTTYDLSREIRRDWSSTTVPTVMGMYGVR